VGACGLPKYETLCVNDAGEVESIEPAEESEGPSSKDILIWNANSQNMMFAHSDIYKGRVARLVSSLLYAEELQCQLNQTCSAPLPQVNACPEALNP